MPALYKSQFCHTRGGLVQTQWLVARQTVCRQFSSLYPPVGVSQQLLSLAVLGADVSDDCLIVYGTDMRHE